MEISVRQGTTRNLETSVGLLNKLFAKHMFKSLSSESKALIFGVNIWREADARA